MLEVPRTCSHLTGHSNDLADPFDSSGQRAPTKAHLRKQRMDHGASETKAHPFATYLNRRDKRFVRKLMGEAGVFLAFLGIY